LVEDKYTIIECEIRKCMSALCLDRMPTRPEMETVGGGLYTKVQKAGGIIKWAERLDLSLKTPHSKYPKGDFNNILDQITKAVKDTQKKLSITRMPSFSEIKDTNKDSDRILNLIRRNGGYRYWADKLNLKLKDCETNLGVDYEFVVEEELQSRGFNTEKMPLKFPYDLLLNEATKVDVKVANLHIVKSNGTSFFKFGINKEYPTCDFYILVALIDEEIYKTLVVPSQLIKSKNLSIGIKSKLDIYKDRYDLLTNHSNYINKLI
jgi:hypothetical protein